MKTANKNIGDTEMEAVKEKIDQRRASVLDAIKKACPRLHNQESLAKRVEFEKQGAYKLLVEKVGYTDLSIGVGANYLSWAVDCRLWGRFQKLLADPMAHKALRDSKPNPADAPFSSSFRKYQFRRLAQKADDAFLAGPFLATNQQPPPEPQPVKPASAPERPVDAAKTIPRAGTRKRKSAAEDDEGGDFPIAKRTRRQTSKAAPEVTR